MTKLLSNEIVDNIIDKTDIVEVIAARIPLKKAGRNFKAACPFHGEKTPSFVVSPDKQIFHCFGCGIGGNALSFLMKYEQLNFREAAKILADKVGVKLPASQFVDKGRDSFLDKLFSLNEAAKNFYKAYLASPNGKLCSRYLKERGISDDTVNMFQLGFAPNLWEGLIAFFKKKDIELNLLEKAGLALPSEKGKGHYDRFRNRIIFPIFDLRNKVVGFGARVLDNSQPKYINSPETPIYNKGRNLYGLNFSKGHIKEKDYAIIVEGYLDLIVPYQYGIKNIGATLGTALTPDQVKLLRRFSKTVIIVFDSDKAGEEASLRGLDILVSLDMNVRIARLPKGYDPDSFIRKNGKIAFEKIVSSSKDLFDYKIDLLMNRFNKDGVRGRAAIATLMLPTIARIPNEILKASFLKKLSGMLSIDESALKAELRKVRRDYSYTVSWQKPQHEKARTSHAELLLLSIILEDPEVLRIVDENLEINKFKQASIKQIINKVKSIYNEGKGVVPSKLIAYFDDEEVKNIISEAVSIRDTLLDRQKVLTDCINRIKQDDFKEELDRLRTEIRFAQDSNDTNKINDLISKYNKLLKLHKG